MTIPSPLTPPERRALDELRALPQRRSTQLSAAQFSDVTIEGWNDDPRAPTFVNLVWNLIDSDSLLRLVRRGIDPALLNVWLDVILLKSTDDGKLNRWAATTSRSRRARSSTAFVNQLYLSDAESALDVVEEELRAGMTPELAETLYLQQRDQ